MKETIIEIVVALVCAAGIGSTLYFQHEKIKRLEVTTVQQQDKVAALEAAQAGTEANIETFNKKLNAVSTRRVIVQKEIEHVKITDPKSSEFLATPIPDGLRDVIDRYLTRGSATSGTAIVRKTDSAPSNGNGQ